MRFSDLDEEQKTELLEQFARILASNPILERQRRLVRETQKDIVIGVFVAGLCAGAIAFKLLTMIPDDFWIEGRLLYVASHFLSNHPWIWIAALIVVGAFFFVAGCSWVYEMEEHMRGGERQTLLSLFQAIQEKGIKLSSKDILALIASR